MIQIDGGLHDWFEGRGPRCTLIRARLTALRFAAVESGAAYFNALWDHVLAYRCPSAFYSDVVACLQPESRVFGRHLKKAFDPGPDRSRHAPGGWTPALTRNKALVAITTPCGQKAV